MRFQWCFLIWDRVSHCSAASGLNSLHVRLLDFHKNSVPMTNNVQSAETWPTATFLTQDNDIFFRFWMLQPQFRLRRYKTHTQCKYFWIGNHFSSILDSLPPQERLALCGTSFATFISNRTFRSWSLCRCSRTTQYQTMLKSLSFLLQRPLKVTNL